MAPTSVSSSSSLATPGVPLPPLVPTGPQPTSLAAPGAPPSTLPHSGVNLIAAPGSAIPPITQLPPPAHGGAVKQLPAPTATSQKPHIGSVSAAVSNSSSVTGNHDLRDPHRGLHGAHAGHMAPSGSSQLAPPSGAVPVSTNVYSGSAISSTVKPCTPNISNKSNIQIIRVSFLTHSSLVEWFQ